MRDLPSCRDDRAERQIPMAKADRETHLLRRRKPTPAKIINEGTGVDAYEAVAPDRSMEPRFNEGLDCSCQPSLVTETGEDVFVLASGALASWSRSIEIRSGWLSSIHLKL